MLIEKIISDFGPLIIPTTKEGRIILKRHRDTVEMYKNFPTGSLFLESTFRMISAVADPPELQSLFEKQRFARILAIVTLYQQNPDWEDEIATLVRENCIAGATASGFPDGWQSIGSYADLKQWYFQNCRS